MLVDGRTLPPDAELEADVCVVGGGPAGLTLARELDGLALRVVVLESGGVEHDPEIDDLGASDDELRFGTVSRLTSTRRLGGNANAWNVRTGTSTRGVRLVPLAEADFEAGGAVPHDGWPIARAALDPCLRRAQAVFGLTPSGFDATDWADASSPPLPLAPERVRTRVFQFGDGRVFTDGGLPAALAASRTVALHHHVTALGLESDPLTGRVVAVRAASAPGRGLRVRAGSVVLAAGGLATTQLLLSSLEDGGLRLGEAADHVGRWFMDHPLLHGGELVPASPAVLDAMALYDLRLVGGTPVMGHLELADELLRGAPVLNLSALLFPRRAGWSADGRMPPRRQAAFDAALRVRTALQDGRRPRAADLARVATGADGVALKAFDSVVRPSSHLARGGWSAQGARIRRAYRSLEVTHQAEQAPHHDNRVLLGRTRDAFGMRRVSVDWRWHDEDVAATMRAQEVYASELERAGVGRFAIARQDGGPVVHSSSTGHFMGTTRMSTGARDGVVDARCRVHGAENLLVVSTSVFPTGGFANPTLTLVALALRVADELRGGVAPAAAAPPAPATVDGDAAPRRARPARRPRPRRVRGRVRG